MITPLPNAWRQKPGSATFPFFGKSRVVSECRCGCWKATGQQGACEQLDCVSVYGCSASVVWMSGMGHVFASLH